MPYSNSTDQYYCKCKFTIRVDALLLSFSPSIVLLSTWRNSQGRGDILHLRASPLSNHPLVFLDVSWFKTSLKYPYRSRSMLGIARLHKILIFLLSAYPAIWHSTTTTMIVQLRIQLIPQLCILQFSLSGQVSTFLNPVARSSINL